MRKETLVACALAMALSGCGGPPASDVADPAADANGVVAASATEETEAEAGANAGDTAGDVEATTASANSVLDRDGNPVPLVAFDIDSVPVSSAALGELPFFSMPAGYGPQNRPHVRAYARFPFRIGEGLHWVEGASWNARITVDDDQGRDKEFSARELRRNLESVLAQAGAQPVFEGPLNRNAYYGAALEQEIGGGFIEGVNMDHDAPTSVHVIRQADRNIWVQLTTTSNEAGLVIVEERPFVATARWTDEFPYLSTPAGYDEGNRPKQRDFDMYPFWTGSDFEEVEGRTWAGQVSSRGRTHSMHEVRRNLEAMMAEVGGTLVFEGRIPKEPSERYDFDLKSPYSDGTGFSWHDYDSRVYRVDLPTGRQVWVHARLEYNSAGWVVVEREGFVQTAAMLPADALKRQLDADGRVAIQVNFATDEADILPESQPQIDQVLALLQADPALALSVEGHTDDTGTVQRNRSLSEARAAAVVAALTGRGIEASRLSAAGFGQDRPVADNATDEGKAKNRRVELVRKP
ncbi:OmpA family protein [Luteimonas viscosa]|uniref:OmpA family protein n=1 Tax=Luteimonas viscosa TaxID=1132694 RepID=A0A5D4XRC6_9GAMM|nr:OmpA family protein [Luteimonas viscosa]TYT26515.1 OmpA family protein [Luteimonas viscosa]